jgi:hypothetical protein
MEEAAKTSAFVTRVARTFIGLSVFGILVGLAQNVVAFGVLPGFEQPGAPAGPSAVDGGARVVSVGVVVLGALTLLVSIGLLKRRAGAHRIFVGLMALEATGCLAWILYESMTRKAILPSQGSPDFLRVSAIIRMVDVGFPVVACLLFSWIAAKLRSPATRAEFH